jgi:16S rRNA (cytosine1402-N4)-methyltransferase
MTAFHQPVMVERVMHILEPKPGGRIVDATLGLGGHAEAILRALGPEGQLIGLDRDPQMLGLAKKRLRPYGSAAHLVQARLSSLSEVAKAAGVAGVDGILMDLGLCSAQIDEPSRGFSFEFGPEPSPLDMRMNQSEGETAAELLERLDETALVAVLRQSDVPAPTKVARALRKCLPIRTTQELAKAIDAIKLPRRRHHPATLVFQALRLAVNDELRELEAALAAAIDLLGPGGRLAILSYHSGEDRRVKEFLTREARGCICPPDLPRCGCGRSPRMKTLARGTGPDPEEVKQNPRARSARLRGGERL